MRLQNSQLPMIFMILSCLLWLFVFRGFIAGDLALKDDAISYYDHTKFFIDNLSQGIYPLWDPTWNAGVPNEFFLRRIGSFNPAYPVMALLQRSGLPPRTTYLLFVSGYFFLGAAGYYHLLRRIFKDPLVAFTGMLLLLFSSFSFVLFGSFIMLIFTPAVWFLYYLFSFLEEPRWKNLLGICFSLMIILTTYIPFYFIAIIAVLIILCALGFYGRIPAMTRDATAFISRRGLFAATCVLLLGVSLAPGWQMFREGKTQSFILPSRHVQAPADNAFSVDQQDMHVGAVVNPKLLLKELFVDLHRIDLGSTYLPFFIYVLLGLGFFTALRRTNLIVFAWGLFFFLVSLKGAGPLYEMLYEHVFFFRYLRNLQFFFILTFYPCIIWLAVAVLKEILDRIKAPLSTSPAAFLVVLIAVTLHPLWVYAHLGENAAKRSGPYPYEVPYQPFSYVRDSAVSVDLERPRQIGAPEYYATAYFGELKTLIDRDILRNYLHHKFVIYDATAPMPEKVSAAELEKVFHFRSNTAWTESAEAEQGQGTGEAQADFVSGPSEEFAVTHFDANSVRLRTNFRTDKFIVYNDSYHPGWRVTIDGWVVAIYRSNIAFKGWWVSAGERTIVLQFGSPLQRAWNYLLVTVFAACFLALCWPSGEKIA